MTIRHSVFTAVLLACAPVSGQEQAILLKGGTLLDGKDGVQSNTGILVQGGKILKIDASARGATYDLTFLTVMPGLIDTHVHLASHFSPDGKLVTREDSQASAMGYAMENAYAGLMAGITTVQSVGSAIDGDVRGALNRGAQTLSDEQITAARGEAGTQHLCTPVHVYSPAAIVSVSSARCTSVEHGTLISNDAQQFLAAHGSYFDVNIGLVAQNYVLNKGGFIGVSGFTEEGRKGTPRAAIISGTSLSAESMNMGDRIGSLAPGMKAGIIVKADIIAVAGNPLNDITALRRVVLS